MTTKERARNNFRNWRTRCCQIKAFFLQKCSKYSKYSCTFLKEEHFKIAPDWDASCGSYYVHVPKHLDQDTIVAVATASGHGGVGIVRLSGANAKSIAKQIIKTECQPRLAKHTTFYASDDTLIDEGVVLFFESPNSFTGEDVVELQGHGGPVVMDQLVKTAIHHGARMARPGEYSERAFLNGKMDLAQAEAIADLINANSEQAARSAVRSLQGEFSKKIRSLQEALTNLRLQVEAMIDFPEEEIDFLNDGRVAQLLQQTIDALNQVKRQAKQGALLQSGIQVVIAGKPNAGKSSLLNYLSGRESAIVTDVPGTTRDALRESIKVDGMPLHVIDTAGLRDTQDAIEKEGMKRAYAHMSEADCVILIVDAQALNEQSLESEVKAFKKTLPTKMPLIVLKNKIDLTHEEPGEFENTIQVSIKNNQGMTEFINYLKQWAGFQSTQEDGFIARRRHVDAIERAYQLLLHGQQQLETQKAGELLAEDLRQAQQALSEITGEFTPDDLLGKIFSSFCIGK